MKRLIALLGLLTASVATAQTTESTATTNLMGLGMPAALAEEVADLVTGDAVFSNNQYIRFRNAAGSANIDVLKVDGSDDTWLNADSGDLVKIGNSGTAYLTLGTTGTLTFSAANARIVGGATSFAVRDSTDSSNNISISDAGALTVRAGITVDSGNVQITTGALSTGSTITSSRTSDLGWAVVDGTDNTACTSQCTSAAVFGFNLSAGATAPVLVGPSDATADICLCAGAS